MKLLDKIQASGHENILCTHKTTIEITKDDYLTLKGNCILGINADKACSDLTLELKTALRNAKKIFIIIEVDNLRDDFYGFGHEKILLKSEKDLVFRKSDYICQRTVLINCSKSSNELKTEIIEKLKDKNANFTLKFILND